jgi:ribosomal protein S27E
LTAWELGHAHTVAERSVMLLGALLPQRRLEDLLAMSLAERDRQLLRAHRLLFGPRLDCVVTCPSCGAVLAFGVAADDLLAAAETDEGTAGDEVEIALEGWHVRARSIELGDVVRAASAPDPAVAREMLLDDCVVSVATPSDMAAVPTGLPSAVEDALLAELERRNPCGTLEFEQTCPDCAHVWTTPFDSAGYVLEELDGWARRTLREVHSLATAYNWHEADILAMSPARRATYLEMAGHA